MIYDKDIKGISFDEIRSLLSENGITGYELSFRQNPNNIYPNYMDGESKACVVEGIYTAEVEDWKLHYPDPKASFKQLEWTSNWNKLCICPVDAIYFLCAIGVLQPHCYLIHQCW
jgi:hypothetical protein